VKDIGLVADNLLANGSSKVGAVGFCMGGALTAAASVEANKTSTKISACAPFYGLPSFTDYPPSELRIPVYGFFGTEDFAKGFSDVETANKFREELDKHEGKYGEQIVKIFDKATHGFCNPAHEDPYNVNAKTAAEAKELSLAFFKRHLF
jgi:carboxymethylenebutenolidase